MKARVKNTGEIVEVSPSGVTTVHRTGTKYTTKDGRELLDLALEFLPVIDWEQRRYEIAKDVLAACLAKYGMNFDESADVGMCKRCVEIANTLIKKLKGGVE